MTKKGVQRTENQITIGKIGQNKRFDNFETCNLYSNVGKLPKTAQNTINSSTQTEEVVHFLNKFDKSPIQFNWARILLFYRL